MIVCIEVIVRFYQLKNWSYRACISGWQSCLRPILYRFFNLLGKEQRIISAFTCLHVPFKFCFVRGVTYAHSWCMTLISVYVQAKISIMYWFKFAPVQNIIHIQSILFNILGHINISRSYKCCMKYNSFVSCLLLKGIKTSNVILKSWKLFINFEFN